MIALHAAGPEDASLLENLLELYLHDLSEVFLIELGADGRFGYETLALYWAEPERRFAFLIKSGERVAGFVLVTRGSPVLDDPNVLDVAEFFVLRRYRREGVGRRAAALLWESLPGDWIVRVSSGNQGALPFWRSVIAEFTGGEFTEHERPGTPHDWCVFSFATQ